MDRFDDLAAVDAHFGVTPAPAPDASPDALNSNDARRQLVILANSTGPLSLLGYSARQKRAGRAIDRLIRTAYCN